jgi:predicted acetyltransferase
MPHAAAVEFRPVQPEEFDAYVALDAYSFAYEVNEASVARMHAVTPLDGTLAAFVDGRMAAHACVYPLKMWLNGAPVPAGGVADVAVWPEQRRGGLARALLERLLERMRDRGQSLSMLYPTFYPLYQRFGYALAAFERRVTGPATAFAPRRAPASEGQVRRVGDDDWRLLAAIYDRWILDANGAVGRDESWWRWRRLRGYQRGPVHAAVWQPGGGPPASYMLYQGPTREGHGNEQSLLVREITGLTPAATGALWQFAAHHDLVERLTWSGPVDDPLPALVADPRALTVTLEPSFMLRIVDLVPALTARANPDPGPLRLRLSVHDDTAPWNTGIWLVEREDGITAVRRTEEAADLTTDIGTLAQLYNGLLTPAAALAAGLVEANDENAIAAAGRLFTVTRQPHCPDYF